MATGKRTRKLVHESTRVSIKFREVIISPILGKVIVENIHAPRQKVGIGSIELKTEDGRIGSYPPSVINAIWI
jgi:hypothetical protein